MVEKSRKRLTEIHIERARSHALRLVAFAGSVFPGEWSDSWSEVVVSDLLEFGFHARKVNEFCGIMENNFPSINIGVVKIIDDDFEDWESSYRHALNALMHMKSFVLGYAHADHRKIFLQAESNLMATYVKVETDRFSEVTISIFGLAECFLNHVIPTIREKELGLTF
ncbi:hypothetical protein DF046_25095 [Burkholderia cepacia]|nr:hypothetical protein DF135_22320 [Burkholderia cepacia]RQT48754.1 hypothetical protein DF046_25095 [Burkholderia cepacia]RQZ89373.1 hypothetical protein DF053_10670 [Burkholderia cepacia]